MKNKWNKYLTISIISLFALIVGSCSSDKTGYVSLGKVVSEFEYSQELQKDREKVINARNAILDSLQIELNVISESFKNGIDTLKLKLFQFKREEYYQKENQFYEDNQALVSKHEEQVMSQLNQYINDFGKENNYKYIFGATGNGSLMFADETTDISEDVITYINQKYSGQK